MSALAWLFGLGALTIAFPILFHLIRRTPKGQMEFSSLMFLKPSPPTLTRRSRLENLLLLFLRVLAIGLIAFAFMRPFFRMADSLSDIEVANRRVAILLDDSASMRRAGVWDDAKKQIESVLDNLESGDDVSLFTFSETMEQVVTFSDGTETVGTDRAGLIREELKSLEPSWGRANLGRVVVNAADSLDVWRDAMKENSDSKLAKLQVVVVSDMQEGSKLDTLQSYQWPESVYVKFLPAKPTNKSNATVQLLNASEDDEKGTLRVRVANDGESQSETFAVTWENEASTTNESESIEFYVPSGTSRVLKVHPDQAVSANQFDLVGDSEAFDNSFFVVPSKQHLMEVAYLGDDKPDDPESLQLYLRSSLMETPTRISKLRQVSGDDPFVGQLRPTLAVIAAPVSQRLEQEIDEYLRSGGSVLVSLTGSEMVASTAKWTGASSVDPENESQDKDNYLMLADIKFSNPIFQPFAKAGYNDFTSIRFWKTQAVALDDDNVQVIANFDNDSPAIWQRTVGSGTVYAIASGWQPTQSQLALSPKFVPLINRMVEVAAELPELSKSLLVNQPIEFSSIESIHKKSMPDAKVVIVKPNGNKVTMAKDETKFTQTNQPGIYSLLIDDDEANKVFFAVNVDRAESGTETIAVAQIEMLGVKVGEQQTAASELLQMRDMKDREIESQQKVWKWLIVAAMLLLIGETCLAGQTTSKMVAGTA